MSLWPLRVYTRKKRAGQRLNLTPPLDLGPPATAQAPPGPKGKGRERGLPKIAEKAEWGKPGGSSSELQSTQLRDTGEKMLQENTCEDTQNEIALLSESVTDGLQVDSSLSNSELVSGASLQHGISSSLLSYSITESYTEYNSGEENLNSFSSPELFRGSDYLDWECPKLTEHVQCKNSTLLDTSKAVAIEKVPEFSNFSAILDNADCEVLLAEKICPSTSEETKKKPGRDSEDRDANIQANLNSHHAQISIVLPQHRPALESRVRSSVAGALLPQPLASTLKTNSHTPNKKGEGLLTSTPSSETAGFVIDLSSVQKSSCEELLPNVSNYVNSNEIVPVSGLQENSSNEFPSRPEICCIIKASPGTRQLKSKGVIVKKKRHSPPKDIPQDIIIKMNDRI